MSYWMNKWRPASEHKLLYFKLRTIKVHGKKDIKIDTHMDCFNAIINWNYSLYVPTCMPINWNHFNDKKNILKWEKNYIEKKNRNKIYWKSFYFLHFLFVFQIIYINFDLNVCISILIYFISVNSSVRYRLYYIVF